VLITRGRRVYRWAKKLAKNVVDGDGRDEPGEVDGGPEAGAPRAEVGIAFGGERWKMRWR